MTTDKKKKKIWTKLTKERHEELSRKEFSLHNINTILIVQ